MRLRWELVITTALTLGVLSGGVGGCGPTPPSSGRPSPGKPSTEAARPAQAFHFALDGPVPWNRTLYYATGAAIDGGEPYETAILDESARCVLRGTAGDAFHLRSERAPSRPETQLLWMVEVRGTLGAPRTGTQADPIRIAAAERSQIHFVGRPDSPGPDVITVYDETMHVAASAIRDERAGLDIAVWAAQGMDAGSGNAYRMAAPPRPWTIGEFASAGCVVAAQSKGHQWTASRTVLGPGSVVEIDARTQATADLGGTVVCEDPNAVLLLHGDLAIPAARKTTRLKFRSRWEGVPPGDHAIRLPDGSVRTIQVAAGGTVRVDPRAAQSPPR